MADDRRAPLETALAVIYLLAAAVALLVGLAPHVGLRCQACSGGIVALALPWMGAAFYAVLAVAAFSAPRSTLLTLAPGFYVFVHADLVTEMLLDRHWCWGCFTVAALALAAALVQLWRARREAWSVGVAALLGCAAGHLSSFDRADELATRTLWPARMLEAAPDWVNRDEMSHCEHAAPIRVLLFEKDCKT
jgi:hypothetical protein